MEMEKSGQSPPKKDRRTTEKYFSVIVPEMDHIKEWAGLLTERQIAERLGINYKTFSRYKTEHPELQQVLIDGKKTLIETLKETLKRKALGFEYTERKVIQKGGEETVEVYTKYAQPDTGAAHLLLKNLDPDWRNDDAETMKLKWAKHELDKSKADEAAWT